MLEQAASQFINSPRGTWDSRKGLGVSSIYVWFSEDFGKTDAAIIEHLLRYADGPARDRLAAANEIADHDYDWDLNAAE